MIKLSLGIFGLSVSAIALLLVSSPSRAVAQGGSCMAEFNQAFANLTQQKPMNSNWGSRDTFQWSYFIGEEGIKILTKYQACLSAEEFAANFEALSGMRDKGRQGCEQLSSVPGSCVPRYPGE